MKQEDEILEEEKTLFPAECIHCGWKGYEDGLCADFYDSHNMSNPERCCCPECGLDVDG